MLPPSLRDLSHPDEPLQGQITRGKTARNRLRRVDNYLLLTEPTLLRRQDGPFRDALYIDLGYGATPVTTLESAARLRRANPSLAVLGVEIEPERVIEAQPFAGAQTHFRLGGFNLPLEAGEHVRIIRAFNVLRQYDEAAVHDAWCELGQHLLPGGLLVEGTSDPFGRVWVANLLRRTGSGLRHESLLFSTNFRWGFAPELFQPVLPKNYIHRMQPGEAIFGFMAAWKQATQTTAAYRIWGLRQWFEASAQVLTEAYHVETRRCLLRLGYLCWYDIPDAPEFTC